MTDLRGWLSRHPHPSSLRVERVDGDERTVRVGVTRSKWRDAESAIGDAVRVEALDSDGATLRVWESDAASDERAKRSPTPATREEVMLARFAELLNDACDKAVMRHTEFVNVAFTQLGSLVQLYAQRNAMLEKAWHKLLVDSAEAQAEAAPDASDAIIGGVMQMALQGASTSTPAPTNGKGKAKPKE